MPKVLRLLNRINVGGPVLNVAYLSKFLQPEFETRILVGNIEPGEGDGSYVLEGMGLAFEKVPNMNRSLHPIRDFKALLYIIKAINEFQPDIVHTHAAKAGALGRFACLFVKKRPAVILHTYHGNVFDGYFSPLKTKLFLFIERSLAKISNGIVSISNLQKEELVHKYAIADDKKINVIPLGFELNKFQQQITEKRIKVRTEFCVDDETVLLVITGRLTEIKNHILFLDIIANCKKLTSVKFKTLLVGNGELYDILKSHTVSLGLRVAEKDTIDGDYDVLFTSWRRDIDCINAGADVAVLTSNNEGTPVSIIEAMAGGKAVITTNVGGVQDFIENGVNGVVTSSDLREYSNNLVKLIADSEFRRTLGENAVSTAFRLFSIDRLISDMRSYYSQLLNQNE
jgi:glycosyltransferase involved in cell wall biosynthesis